MIYGNAEFMRIPWETIIKLHRKKLGTTARDTVEAYADSFFAALLTDFPMTPDEEKKSVASIIESYFDDILREMHETISSSNQSFSDANVRKIVKDSVHRCIKRTESLSDLKLGQVDAAFVRKTYQTEINTAIKMFGSYATAACKTLLAEYAVLVLTKEIFSSRMSGVVFAGFGESQIFPSLVEYCVDGVIGGAPRARKLDPMNITKNMRFAVVPFAIKDMVYRFMEGIDPQYVRYLARMIENVCVSNAVDIVKKYVPGSAAKQRRIKGHVTKVVRSAVSMFIGTAQKYRRQNFVQPILDMGSLLPKEELANLAEALVNLTSLQMRVSTEAEAVGGPIDVAVISKGDGFVWIKRKYYFDPELNPGFMQKYFTV